MTTPLEDIASDKTASNGYKVKLEVFEGPLDLLLYLIKKEEIDIYDIPIARVTEQYLEYIKLMQQLNIDVAGEFLLTAATLIHIKSKMLLPPPPIAEPNAFWEDSEDPRRELVHKLLEHKKFRAAAEMLWSKAEIERAVFTRASLDIDRDNPEVNATVLDLIEIFKKICERHKEQTRIKIEREHFKMEQKIDEIRAIFKDQGCEEISITDIFLSAGSREELIVLFLAVLELAKEAVIRLVQNEPLGEIRAIKR